MRDIVKQRIKERRGDLPESKGKGLNSMLCPIGKHATGRCSFLKCEMFLFESEKYEAERMLVRTAKSQLGEEMLREK